MSTVWLEGGSWQKPRASMGQTEVRMKVFKSCVKVV